MARQKTDFTNFINAHPNYFPGQYLLEDDFEIQHQYLSERQRYHQQSLHVSGIIEGLEVEVITDKKEVQVKSGAAINSNGDLIVLKINTSFTDFENRTSGELYLRYKQEKQLKQQEDYTRWQEIASLEFAATSPSDGVKLAKITIAGDTVTLDASIRSYSGIFLPNAKGNDLTLCSGGDANPNLAILTGSLSVTGDLTVSNNFTANNGAITNVLAIGDKPFEGNTGGNRDWMTRGIKVFWDSDNLFIGLKDEGANRKDAVIAWGDDPQDNLRFIHAQSAGSIPGNEVMKLTPSGNLSVGTIQGSLTINTGGAGNWNKFVVNTTSDWGDGTTQYVTIGAGGASGIMIFNPHITWQTVEKRASIRYGKSGGVASGTYWDVGVRENGTFSFAVNGITDHKLSLLSNGDLSIPGTISFGSTVRQMINLWSTGYGIGVQNGTQYFRSDSNFAWYKGGSHNDTQFNAGTNGTSLMTLNGNGNLSVSASSSHLQLRREKTETTGGKYLFLELYQDDPTVTIPEVYPSIRFHHGNRYWHRIEARGNGFHFKDGNIDVDTYKDIYANAIKTPSDINLKTDISEISNPLEKLLSLRGIYFSWKDKTMGTSREIGVIAQEVEQVFPELVTTINGEQRFVKYDKFVAILIEAIKEQQQLISQLREDIERIKITLGL